MNFTKMSCRTSRGSRCIGKGIGICRCIGIGAGGRGTLLGQVQFSSNSNSNSNSLYQFEKNQNNPHFKTLLSRAQTPLTNAPNSNSNSNTNTKSIDSISSNHQNDYQSQIQRQGGHRDDQREHREHQKGHRDHREDNMISDITVAWDINLINSFQCLYLLKVVFNNLNRSPVNNNSNSIGLFYSSYLHVASFHYHYHYHYDYDKSDHHLDHEGASMYMPESKSKFTGGIKSLLHSSPSAFFQLFNTSSSSSPSKALDNLISFLMSSSASGEGNINYAGAINALFNLLLSSSNLAASSMVSANQSTSLLVMLVEKYAALNTNSTSNSSSTSSSSTSLSNSSSTLTTSGTESSVRCLVMWNRFLERLVKSNDIPLQTWMIALYSILVTDKHPESIFKMNSIDWKHALMRDSKGQVEMLERINQYPHTTIFDALIVLLMHFKENEKIVNACMYSLHSSFVNRSRPSVSQLGKASILIYLNE